MDNYKKRIELNSKKSDFTGNVLCYYGKSSWDDKELNSFIKISDCNHTITLHPNLKNFDSNERKQFIEKLKRLNKGVNDFISFLEAINDDL